MTTAADVAAVKALIESVPSLIAYLSYVPAGTTPAKPYVLQHPSAGVDEATRHTGPRLTQHPEMTLHIVGASTASVLVTLDLVKAKLVDANGFAIAPTVSGRSNKNAYYRSPLPIQLDQSVTPWLPYAVVEFGWTSDPA